MKRNVRWESNNAMKHKGGLAYCAGIPRALVLLLTDCQKY